MPVALLEREMYAEAHAARLLNVAQGTLHYWLEGAERDTGTYPPIIREAPKHTRSVTWGEFVEAGMLRQYRRQHKIPMKELRIFVDLLRRELGVRYPLADRRPYASGRALVYDLQTAAQLDREYWLVTVADNQPMLTPPSANFYDRVGWEKNVAALWRPDPNPDSPVRIDPNIRFGQPAIKGISTHAIWEQVESGEEVVDVATIYRLKTKDVRAALAYENAQAA